MSKIIIPVRHNGCVGLQTMLGLKFGSYSPTEYQFESDVCNGLRTLFENNIHLKESISNDDNDDNDDIREAKIKVREAADNLHLVIAQGRMVDEQNACDQLQEACSHLHHVSTIVVLPAAEEV